jgi:glycosyltransferase involved in cell wall biosynthesis
LREFVKDGGVCAVAKQALLKRDEKRALERTAENRTAALAPAGLGPAAYPEDANLVGYSRGEFGMGEHCRATVRAFSASGMPFSVIDYPERGLHGTGDSSIEHWLSDRQRYGTNVLCINADNLPMLYFSFGESFFSDRYNIGYWAWELERCPPEFDVSLSMVDEVWANSEFAASSLASRSQVPVLHMPLSVSLPPLRGRYSKAHFGLPEDAFQFVFTFDAASYLARKNPIAVVRAFKSAFPSGDEKVALLLKTMNVPAADPLWRALRAETQTDPRIVIMDRRLSREQVIGLNSVCDAFVSLHRSEGFGFSLAEAMLLGKPVIATNYSGTRDFAREGTACVVDYRLVPASEGSYLFWQDQVWAEPDLEAPAPATEEEIVGDVDLPAAGSVIPAHSGAIKVVGWFAAKAGIESVEIECDGLAVVRAYHGIMRQDLGAAFPDLPAAARSGFGCILDSESLSPGAHRLRVVARSKSGAAREIARELVVARASAYEQWLAGNALDPPRRKELAERAAKLKPRPLLTLVLAAGSPADEPAISRSLASLADQVYRDFEVVVAADEHERKDIGALPAVAAIANDVRLVPRDGQDWTRALASCRGDFIGMLDPGDVLDPRALLAVAENIGCDGTIDLLYADEDRLTDDGRSAPGFKPAFSPIYLDGHNYIGRPWFARAELLRSAAQAVDADGPASEDLMLRRLASAARAVCHIPTVLVSRPGVGEESHVSEPGAPDSVIPPPARGRACPGLDPGSTADRRSGGGPGGAWPRVSIVIPTCLENREVAARCFSGLVERTDYPHLEPIVVINNVADLDGARAFLAQWPFKVLTWEGAYTWSGIGNFAARQATGEHLLFLNDDVDPLDPLWLKQMVRLSCMPTVGAVGAMLKYPNGTIQHAGMTIAQGTSCGRHLFRFHTGQKSRIAALAGNDREWATVTGACLLTRRDCFDRVAGFDESFRLVANDVDYCLRLGEQGYCSVVAAAAVLTHHEALSRARMPEADDLKRFWDRWGTRLPAHDPFTNPNLNAHKDDWSVDPGAVGSLQGRVRRNKF